MSASLPIGFRYAGLSCGIKKSGKPDLALIVADRPVATAGVYTQNLVRAASIDWNRDLTPGRLRAVVINSGNANACTGAQGVADNREMAQLVAEQLDATENEVLVLSTGIIGETLPMTKLRAGIPKTASQLDADEVGYAAASTAILTTDQSPKTAEHLVDGSHGRVSVRGMAKGAGMIGPKMATMLAVVTTDADLTPQQADQFLRAAVDQSFNCISVDGHTSTNDAVLLLASGEVAIEPDDEEKIAEAISTVCLDMAKQIPADGEGATHVIEIAVSGAENDRDARSIAKTVASSPLVKTAITGADPNWGRIVSAAGHAEIPFEVEKTSLRVNDELIFSNGTPCSFDARALSQSMADAETVIVDLCVGPGQGSARFWTSDLTVDYVRFNSEYHT